LQGVSNKITANVKGLTPADEINELSNLMQERLVASLPAGRQANVSRSFFSNLLHRKL